MDASSLPEILASGQLFTLIDSLQSTKYLAVACFSLLVYDYCLTFEQEVKLFWRSKVTITRVLFFLNRYLPPINSFVVLTWFFRAQPPQDFCYNAMLSTATLTVFELIIMQAILVARVVHLWTWKQAVQRSVFAFFLLCVAVVIIVFGFVMEDTDAIVLPLPLRGCFDIMTGPNARLYWAMLVPTFIMETILVALTVIRIAGPLRNGDYKNKVLKCLMRDGCVFYFCVCVCVGFGVVGSAMWDHPRVAFPAIFSGFLPILLSICASRILFNLHELAEELVGQPTFALNNVELGRLNLRKGPRHGEFIVDLGACSYPQSPTDEARWSMQKGMEMKPKTVKSEQDWLPYIQRLSKFHLAVGSFRDSRHAS